MSTLVSILLSIVSTPWRAFVLFKIWFWFLVPAWPVLAAPKWNIYGISIIVGWLSMHIPRETKTQEDGWVYMFVACAVVPAFVLFTAWVIKAVCL